MNRRYSLKKSYEIQKIMALRKSVGNKFYAVYYQLWDGDMKIAISVSKKVGCAVIRNHEKRVVKEIVSKTVSEKKGIKALIIVKKTVLDLSFQEKYENLSYLLSKIKKENKNEKK